MREFHELKEECSLAKQGKLYDVHDGETFVATLHRKHLTRCQCRLCQEFEKVVPLGEPLLSSLGELPEADSGADTGRQSTNPRALLGHFTSPSDEGRDISDGDWDESTRDLVPAPEQISISAFLVRKMDGKRLELTADAKVANRHANEYEDDEVGHFGWTLSPKGVGRVIGFKAEFQAHVEWKDLAELETPPEGLTEGERDEWAANHPHVPELAIRSMDISVRQRACGCGFNESCQQCRRWTAPNKTPRIVDVDSLLAMLRSDTFESRWM